MTLMAVEGLPTALGVRCVPPVHSGGPMLLNRSVGGTAPVYMNAKLPLTLMGLEHHQEQPREAPRSLERRQPFLL